MSKGRKVTSSKKGNLFIIADAGIDSGFAQVTHNLINYLYKDWDINVLAINYYGDPHPIQQKAQLWNPMGVMHGDLYGLSRVPTLAETTNADVILVINDPWIAAEYAPVLKKVKAPRVLYTPVDAKHIKTMFVEKINEVYDHVIGYTQFGVRELTESGLTLPASVIPHGVDTTQFYPIDRKEAREKGGIDPDYFIVQMVDRNQKRKRIDLGMYYFSKWVRDKPNNVMFYYHGAVKDEGWDIGDLAEYFGIHDRLILSHQNLNPAHGFPLEYMKLVYSIADIKLSTTQGEGFGLTTMESMACGVPNIVPRYSALGEWANGGVLYTDIDKIPVFNTNGLNTQGGIPTMESTIRHLEALYNDSALRAEIGNAGRKLVTQDTYNWRNIAKQFDAIFTELKNRPKDNSDDDE